MREDKWHYCNFKKDLAFINNYGASLAEGLAKLLSIPVEYEAYATNNLDETSILIKFSNKDFVFCSDVIVCFTPEDDVKTFINRYNEITGEVITNA